MTGQASQGQAEQRQTGVKHYGTSYVKTKNKMNERSDESGATVQVEAGVGLSQAAPARARNRPDRLGTRQWQQIQLGHDKGGGDQ